MMFTVVYMMFTSFTVHCSLHDVHCSLNGLFQVEARFDVDKEEVNKQLVMEEESLYHKYKAREVCASSHFIALHRTSSHFIPLHPTSSHFSTKLLSLISIVHIHTYLNAH